MPTSSARPTRTSRGYLLRGLFLAVVVLVGGWALSLALPRTKPVPRPPIDPPPPRLAVTKQVQPLQDQVAALPTAPIVPLTSDAVQQTLRKSVCEIIGLGPEGNRTLGAGVIVNSQEGGVVTCLHVVAQTTEPGVRLADGTVLEVRGCRSIDIHQDLAYLVLRNAPPLTVIQWHELQDDATPPVVAAGHPDGASFSLRAGKVFEQTTTARLLRDEQAFVGTLLKLSSEPIGFLTEKTPWLVHSAPLEEGFSGGPLLDSNGQAVGLNVWINETQQRAFAVPAKRVEEFIQHAAAAPDKLLPIEQFVRPEVRERARRWKMSGEQLRTVFGQAQAMRWQPATREDYAILQQLAFGLNLARDDELLQATGRTARHVDELAKASHPVLTALDKETWSDPGQLLLINEFASLTLPEIETGWIGFVRVEEVLSSNEKEVQVLVELSGFEERLIAIVDKSLTPPKPGDQWVLLGVQQRSRIERAGERLPVIVSHVAFSLGN